MIEGCIPNLKTCNAPPRLSMFWCEECLFDAFERMTDGGLRIEWLSTRASEDNPWGHYRFSGISPVNIRYFEPLYPGVLWRSISDCPHAAR
jgi:hypothetical protein